MLSSGRRGISLFLVFIIGFISNPPGFSFWGWINEVARNPAVAVPVFYLVTAIFVGAALYFVVKNFNDNDGRRRPE